MPDEARNWRVAAEITKLTIKRNLTQKEAIDLSERLNAASPLGTGTIAEEDPFDMDALDGAA